jgi:hypothetical protein
MTELITLAECPCDWLRRRSRASKAVWRRNTLVLPTWIPALAKSVFDAPFGAGLAGGRESIDFLSQAVDRLAASSNALSHDDMTSS